MLFRNFYKQTNNLKNQPLVIFPQNIQKTGVKNKKYVYTISQTYAEAPLVTET